MGDIIKTSGEILINLAKESPVLAGVAIGGTVAIVACYITSKSIVDVLKQQPVPQA